MRRALLLTAALHAAGCLSASYRIRPDELQRLAQTDPEARWQRVRAVQGIGGDAPPSGTAVVAPVAFVPDPIGVALMPGVVHPRRVGRPQVAPAPASRPSGGRGGGGGGGGGGGRLDAWAIAAVVVGAAVGAFLLAGVEGARYDGWIATNPDEPLYLDIGDGVAVVPISQLSPALAAQSRGATVYEGYAPRFTRLGRAPLNRVGFTLQSSAVIGVIPGSRENEGAWAYGGRAFFGGFPIQQLGIGLLADVVSNGPETLVRVGAEAQVMPITWVGAYAGGGYASAYRAEPTRSNPAPWFHAGAQVEGPITTRLSVLGRAGAQWTGIGAGGTWGPAFALGLAVY